MVRCLLPLFGYTFDVRHFRQHSIHCGPGHRVISHVNIEDVTEPRMRYEALGRQVLHHLVSLQSSPENGPVLVTQGVRSTSPRA